MEPLPPTVYFSNASRESLEQTKVRCEQMGYIMGPLRPLGDGYEVRGKLSHEERIRRILKQKKL